MDKQKQNALVLVLNQFLQTKDFMQILEDIDFIYSKAESVINSQETKPSRTDDYSSENRFSSLSGHTATEKDKTPDTNNSIGKEINKDYAKVVGSGK
jgi:hypothetical protein